MKTQDSQHAFLKELVAIEKRAIYSQGKSQSARISEVEKLVDMYLKELANNAPEKD